MSFAQITVTDTRARAGSARGGGDEFRVLDADGTVRHYLCEGGPLHRMTGPAVENLTTGRREWWDLGRRHRLDGPAVEEPSRSITEYWRDGDRHREDGPAVERPGRIEYWRWNLLHRDNGPAVITASDEFWYRLGYPCEPHAAQSMLS